MLFDDAAHGARVTAWLAKLEYDPAALGVG
jgi:hypothetical protein